MTLQLIILIIAAAFVLAAWLKIGINPRNVLAIAFIIGLSVFSIFFYQSRQPDTSLRVVGYSSKLFESDLVKWNITLQKTVPLSDINRAYRSMNEDIKAFKEYLISQGIEEKDISVKPISSYEQRDYNGNIIGRNFHQNLFILSSDIDKIEDLALSPDFFAARGMVLEASNLEYLYTKLPELKQELLAAATADALMRAKEISGSAQTRLGKLREARAGVFQITEPYSTDVADYGIYNTSTRQKSISVTLTAHFRLK